uniref:Uncharacterized protein n=1 Tax=Vespula pensylvanica TaxID=30213 RepID=A0A834UGA8_VESPE|nr:hypothetical protein H0235_000318 [Vespula pensylvanica]
MSSYQLTSDNEAFNNGRMRGGMQSDYDRELTIDNLIKDENSKRGGRGEGKKEQMKERKKEKEKEEEESKSTFDLKVGLLDVNTRTSRKFQVYGETRIEIYGLKVLSSVPELENLRGTRSSNSLAIE